MPCCMALLERRWASMPRNIHRCTIHLFSKHIYQLPCQHLQEAQLTTLGIQRWLSHIPWPASRKGKTGFFASFFIGLFFDVPLGLFWILIIKSAPEVTCWLVRNLQYCPEPLNAQQVVDQLCLLWGKCLYSRETPEN